MKGTSLCLAKQGSDEITFHFVTTRTNLFPSYSLTHAEGAMEYVGSKPISLSNCMQQLSCSV